MKYVLFSVTGLISLGALGYGVFQYFSSSNADTVLIAVLGLVGLIYSIVMICLCSDVDELKGKVKDLEQEQDK